MADVFITRKCDVFAEIEWTKSVEKTRLSTRRKKNGISESSILFRAGYYEANDLEKEHAKWYKLYSQADKIPAIFMTKLNRHAPPLTSHVELGCRNNLIDATHNVAHNWYAE